MQPQINKISLAVLSTLLLSQSVFSATLSGKAKENSLIVYNGNVGLVHEKRALNINKKDKTIIYEDVANTIETDSVNVKLDDSIKLYSQQYRYDKLTQKKLLDAHIEKSVLVRVPKDSDDFETKKATLLSNDGRNSIVRLNDSKIITIASDNIIFKNIPNELITKPSLVWNVDVSKNIKTDMEVDYLIKNIEWKSDYILNLNADKANLSGWITINNRSGKKFNDTSLSVLAGDINRAYRPNKYYKESRVVPVMADAPAVTSRAHEGYHFYTIPFKVNLANNEKTQIKFIDEKNISVKRKYSSTLSNPSYLRGERKHNVTQYVTIKTLDFPLPKGVVRTYSKLDKSNILLGESNIEHTPKHTPIELVLGKNFDLKITESIVRRDDTQNYYDATLKYTIKNSSKENKIVQLLIPFNKHSSSSIKTKQKYSFTKGNMVTFNIEINKDSSSEFEVNFRTKR